MKKKFVLVGLFLLACCQYFGGEKTSLPEKATYLCGDKKITIEYQSTESLVLSMGELNFLLINTVSASGAKYENKAARLVFWNKGDDNTLIIDDKVYPPCEEIN